MDSLQIVNTVITVLDQVTVQGARNMSLMLQSIQLLGQLRESIEKEQSDVQNKAE